MARPNHLGLLSPAKFSPGSTGGTGGQPPLHPWADFAWDAFKNTTMMVVVNTVTALAFNYFKEAEIPFESAVVSGALFSFTYMTVTELGRMYKGESIRKMFGLAPLKACCLFLSLFVTPPLTCSSTYWMQRQITPLPTGLFSTLDTAVLAIMQLYC